jgi:hypothetical protein
LEVTAAADSKSSIVLVAKAVAFRNAVDKK